MLTDNDIATTGASASEIEFTMAAFDTAEAFGNVNVRKKGDTYQIQFTLLLEPQKHLSKAWKTGVAMDASASMKNVYGRRMQGFMTEDVVKVYKKKGWFTRETRDGRRIYTFQRAAVDDALARGIVSLSSNTMDFVAPELLTYLANHLDMDSETPLIYFSGGNGSELEVIATLSENEAANLNIDGPNHMMFGDKSRLLPAVEYFTETYQSAPMGMFVFITDGNIDDIAELRHYCARLANDIAADKRNIVKCILVGIGDDVDIMKLQEITRLAPSNYVKIWDYMAVTDLQDFLQIFAEVIKETQIIAEYGTIYDAHGNILKQYAHGLPGRLVFSMTASSPWFELELPNQPRIRQIVTIPKHLLGG